MNRSQRIRLAAIGIAFAVAVAAVVVAFPRGSKQITVTAFFRKSIGLFPQSKVRVLGVAIGRVSSVTPEGDRVKVVMRIDAKRKIPADAKAVIVPISLIADRYVQLTPFYISGPVMLDKAMIPLERTVIPAELDDLLAQLKKLLDAVRAGTVKHPESIGAAVKNLASALEGAGNDLSTTLGGAGALAGAVTENAARLDEVTIHLSRLLAALAQRRNDLGELNVRLAQALGAIASERAALDGALSNVALLTGQLDTLVKEHRSALESDVTVLAKTTQVLIRHQDSLIRGLDWLHVLADGAEAEHNGGAVHKEGAGPWHIDVRDAHLYPCPIGVPTAACLLTGLTTGASLGVPAGATAGPGATVGMAGTSAAPAKPAAPNPLNLLNLLPKAPLDGLRRPVPASTPGIRSLFDGLGGMVDRAFGWFW